MLGKESASENPVIATAATRLIEFVEDIRLAAHSLPPNGRTSQVSPRR
ncbi:hypothetical protein OHA72_27720 [Dactylosporangium sp. NBC_01737]|nr:hypothetical protein OHA72_27720 [Dactylosporangium sp. NBC_01737]